MRKIETAPIQICIPRISQSTWLQDYYKKTICSYFQLGRNLREWFHFQFQGFSNFSLLISVLPIRSQCDLFTVYQSGRHIPSHLSAGNETCKRENTTFMPEMDQNYEEGNFGETTIQMLTNNAKEVQATQPLTF